MMVHHRWKRQNSLSQDYKSNINLELTIGETHWQSQLSPCSHGDVIAVNITWKIWDSQDFDSRDFKFWYHQDFNSHDFKFWDHQDFNSHDSKFLDHQDFNSRDFKFWYHQDFNWHDFKFWDQDFHSNDFQLIPLIKHYHYMTSLGRCYLWF